MLKSKTIDAPSMISKTALLGTEGLKETLTKDKFISNLTPLKQSST